MKSYRVLEPAPRPEIELLLRLDEVGFKHLLGPVARWERAGWDLALVREYVPGAVEGRCVGADVAARPARARRATGTARTSDEVGAAGGDLGSEMRRLGEITGAPPPGSRRGLRCPARSAAAAGDFRSRDQGSRRLPPPPGAADRRRLDRRRFRGRSAHRQVRRERGEPRSCFASPLEDLADLSYSLRQVAAEAVAARPPSAWASGRSLGRVLGAAQPGGARRRLPRRRGHRPARGAGPLCRRELARALVAERGAG